MYNCLTTRFVHNTNLATETTWRENNHFLAFILLLFAYSSIIGNYAYAESNIRFIKNKPWFVWTFRLSVLFFVYFGSVKSGNVVWNFADTVMAVMAIINLVAIVLLSPIVWKLMKDYQRQLKAG